MKALVTGGAGFIGSNLVDGLCARGDDVVVVDDLSTGSKENLEPALAEHAVDLIVEDVTDAPALARIVDSVRPECIYHLAAQIDVRRSLADPGFDARVNIEGTINVLESALRVGGPRVVFASTGGAIYGEGADRELPLAEDAECRPDAPYGQSKLAAEGYLELYRRNHGVPAVALRLANVYGPRQDPLGEAGVVGIFCGRMLAGRRPTVFGTGAQTRDFVYVGDVVRALTAAAEHETPGPVNVGTGRETSVLDLVVALGQLGGGAFEPEMAPARPGEIERIAIDSSRARDELGWSAETGLAEGLEQTLAAVSAGR